jgi:hypothetical protein
MTQALNTEKGHVIGAMYTKFREAKAWLEATEAWQAIRAISKAARQHLTEMKKSAADPDIVMSWSRGGGGNLRARKVSQKDESSPSAHDLKLF